jgi:hypothetical protein
MVDENKAGIGRRIGGGLTAVAGFILSPLSWWNDLYVNFPIAYGCAWILSLFDRRFFDAALIIAYLGTNLLGLILLRKGGAIASGKSAAPVKWTREILVTVMYTLIIGILAAYGLIRVPGRNG